MFRLILVLALLWAVPAGAVTIPQSLNECNALCAQYFPGGVPVTLPVTPPSGNKTFPHPVTFERETTQGNGAAGILFRTLQAGAVTYVSVNGEVARQGTPYKGAPVFLLTKSGDQYARPLSFVIKMADGVTYTAKSGSDTTPGTPVAGYKYQKTYTSYGERNGGRKAWRVPEQGPTFGANIKVVFADGHTVIVKDPYHNYREGDGFVFKPGLGPNGEGEHDTGTAHHGVYLHAPYGNKSNTVTFYYNGQ